MQRAVIEHLGDRFRGDRRIVWLKRVDHEPGVIGVTDGERKIIKSEKEQDSQEHQFEHPQCFGFCAQQIERMRCFAEQAGAKGCAERPKADQNRGRGQKGPCHHLWVQ